MRRTLFAIATSLASLAQAAPQADVQFSLCQPPEQIQRALALKPEGAVGEVWLFDDTQTSLYKQGVRLRLRPAKGNWELTLKLAEQDCEKLAADALPAGEGKCEYDLHGDKLSGALSLTHALDDSIARELTRGAQPLTLALSAAQKRVLAETPGAWPLPAGLRALGPTKVQRYRTPRGAHRYDVDVSVLPGGERYVEISSKVPRAEALTRRDETLAGLKQAGVTVCADQTAQAGNKLRSLASRP
jgi:hypothetical protein